MGACLAYPATKIKTNLILINVRIELDLILALFDIVIQAPGQSYKTMIFRD